MMTACSVQNQSADQQIVIKFSKEIISNIAILEPKISNHVNNLQTNNKDEIFSNSWVSIIKATQKFNEKTLIEIEEHQPIATLENDRFLTQEGKIISPDDMAKNLSLISISGADDQVEILLNYARLMQNVLNLKGKKLQHLGHEGTDFIKAQDNYGTNYLFNKGDFRVQLERLEQFILFELSSGNKDRSKYIDLRYRNAIAVSTEKMEKAI
jgi:cell division septal protein FtsQ